MKLGVFVAQIGEVKYLSIQSAIKAAKTAETTVKLIADSKENVSIAQG